MFSKKADASSSTAKMMGNDSTSTSNNNNMALQGNPATAPPFAKKHPTRTDVLIRSADLLDHPVAVYGDGRSKIKKANILEILKQSHSGKKGVVIEARRVFDQIETSTLTLPGYQVMSIDGKAHWSRTINVMADAWRDQADANADAFVYVMEFDQGNEQGWLGQEWQRERFLISHLLGQPSLVENPTKPLMLLVNDAGLDEDLTLGRVVNLLGLGSIHRPFRAMSYSTQNGDELLKGLEWLKRVVSSADEGTAMTECETEEECSIVPSPSVFFPDTYVLDYEPTLLGGNATLQLFEPIKRGTHCPFAAAAKLWGGKMIDPTRPQLRMKVEVEEAAALNAGPLAGFVSRLDDGEHLDGFCLLIPNAEFVDIDVFGKLVCHVLAKLAALDPCPGENAMRMGPIHNPHWRFRFAGADFFITTFSPNYPTHSSRYAFRARKGFMLFQPIQSFGRYNLGDDTPASATNWACPASMRDKTRAAFVANGRPYFIPEQVPYPVAEHIVKPEIDDGTTCIRWWDHLGPADLSDSQLVRVDDSHIRSRKRGRDNQDHH